MFILKVLIAYMGSTKEFVLDNQHEMERARKKLYKEELNRNGNLI